MSGSAYSNIPTIIFGAFDRHNFGDLIFPHVWEALAGGTDIVHAGLVERNLVALGGHKVHAIADLAIRYRDQPVRIVHAGGELLTCGAWEAAVMSLPADEAQALVRRFDGDAQATAAWARERLKLRAFAPYVVGRSLFPRALAILHNAVGGAELDALGAAMRVEVREKMAGADGISVRDRRTLAHLQSFGLAAELVPDPAVMVAELFGSRMRIHAAAGEVLQYRQAFPEGYLALQFSVDFGDDATLSTLAEELDQFIRQSGCGVVLFRAGAAPWHDGIDAYRRLAMRMQSPAVRIMSSLHLWDICALLAHCRAYAGSSLHGRIVAAACALPRVTLCRSDTGSGFAKHAAYADTWEDSRQQVLVEPAMLCPVLLERIRSAQVDFPQQQAAAKKLASLYRTYFDTLKIRIDGGAAHHP
ncbi:polysaccharide pyruvyl transferase family protein [Noviherbaspirillum aerium]|uniref:polysaccharide pyruvyl transferase family protein n=1 Tax=Noviherbaspirillum aerium TaxID=2588497 RepID=UPI00124CE0D2|nr:polysaccharide pyruvyl transferase family protein [Noviherbaspirillum aerium]